MVRTPDGHSRLELTKFHAPPVLSTGQNAPANTLGIRRIMFAVDDIEDVLVRLQALGAELVGELEPTHLPAPAGHARGCRRRNDERAICLEGCPNPIVRGHLSRIARCPDLVRSGRFLAGPTRIIGRVEPDLIAQPGRTIQRRLRRRLAETTSRTADSPSFQRRSRSRHSRTALPDRSERGLRQSPPR
jgi:hypothetical protein